MVASRTLASYLDSRLSGRYTHFVNDADIVPRVPPGYSHCGSLIWFKEDGIHRSKPRPPIGASPEELSREQAERPVPLSDAEFQQLKADLKRKKETVQKLPDGRPLVQGNTPWIRDHSIGLYLDRIRSFIGKIGALLRSK
jgi:hypothetical protein